MSTLAQIIGIVLATVGVWLLWSPYALIIGGCLLLVGPELASARRRGQS